MKIGTCVQYAHMCAQRSIINYDGVALFTLTSVPSKGSICATNRSENLFEQHNKKDRSLKEPQTSENSLTRHCTRGNTDTVGPHLPPTTSMVVREICTLVGSHRTGNIDTDWLENFKVRRAIILYICSELSVVVTK